MKDQIDFLTARGVDAARLDSSLGVDELRSVEARLRDGRLKLLYVSPERFNNERFLAQLERTRIALFAVDEAHCISEWGHNFRPDYLKLAQRARELEAERVLALTATATPAVVDDICSGFGIDAGDAVVTGFYRPNLTLLTTPVTAIRPRRAARRAAAVAAAGLRDRLRHAAANRRARGGAALGGRTARPRLPRGHERRGARRRPGLVELHRTAASSSPRSRSGWASTRPTSASSTTTTSRRASSRTRRRSGGRGATAPSRSASCSRAATTCPRSRTSRTATRRPGRRWPRCSTRSSGTTDGAVFSVSEYELSARFDIRPLVLKTVLTYLELEGLLRQGTPYYAGYRIRPLSGTLDDVAAGFDAGARGLPAARDPHRQGGPDLDDARRPTRPPRSSARTAPESWRRSAISSSRAWWS